MSQENVEIVRSLNEAFDARDIEAFVAAHHPNAEVSQPSFADSRAVSGTRRNPADGGGNVRGGTGFRIQIDEIRDCGSRVLLLGRQRGTVGGVPIAEVLAAMYEIEGGKVTRSQDFATVDEALEAAGLSE